MLARSNIYSTTTRRLAIDRGPYNPLLERRELRFDLPDLSAPGRAGLSCQRILVTGSQGFIGRRVCNLVAERGGVYIAYDLPHADIFDQEELFVAMHNADAIIHLAAVKLAGDGEHRPEEAARVNIEGTMNVVKAAEDRPVIFASTCKAADPCTVYGASKLIAERIVLNAGGTVLRLVNVIGSTGHSEVFTAWQRNVDAGEALPITHSYRMWMSLEEAAQALIFALSAGPGRFIPNVAPAEHVRLMAQRAFPGHQQVDIPLRRGDRPRERLVAEYETTESAPGHLTRVIDPWEERHEIDGWSAPDPWRREASRPPFPPFATEFDPALDHRSGGPGVLGCCCNAHSGPPSGLAGL